MTIRDIAVMVGGFLTPGTLTLAFATFWRQRREDQLAGARLVIATLDRDGSSADYPSIKVTNHSTGPISQVWISIPVTNCLSIMSRSSHPANQPPSV